MCLHLFDTFAVTALNVKESPVVFFFFVTLEIKNYRFLRSSVQGQDFTG